MNKFLVFLKSILVPVALGSLIGFLISGSMGYEEMPKPFLAPPSIVFPIVWTILYILMGVSYGILKNNNLTDTKTSFLYYSQLIVNLIWPILFFVLDFKFFSFLWIILLIILTISMIKAFYEKNKISGILQIPYLIWLCFAAYLNLAIFLMS